MPLKDWVLEGANRLGALLARPDLPPRDETGRVGAYVPARFPAGKPAASASEELGAYAPLIDAIREELEQFVATQVRLHLAIAEQDRFVLAAIAIRCDGGEALDLLQRFRHEFTPAQVGRYLERHVIAALPDASALDLSEFGGLAQEGEASQRNPADEEFGDLLQLLAAPGGAPEEAYAILVRGHWRQPVAAGTAPGPGDTGTNRAATVVLVDDAQGSRKLRLEGVARGRRYVAGKHPDCDLVVAGTFVSRRHCELWLDPQGWWVRDAGSTNGLRVEVDGRVVGTSRSVGAASDAVLLPPGHRIVLSALAVGEARDYPGLALQLVPDAATQVTPIAPAGRVPVTPVTPIATARWFLTAHMSAGSRTLPLYPGQLPFTVGRSRNQALVIEPAHEGASGRHLEIVQLDAQGALVVVHGDNGVLLDGAVRPAGDRFHWRAGDSMVIGRADPAEPLCMLTLSGAA